MFTSADGHKSLSTPIYATFNKPYPTTALSRLTSIPHSLVFIRDKFNMVHRGDKDGKIMWIKQIINLYFNGM